MNSSHTRAHFSNQNDDTTTDLHEVGRVGEVTVVEEELDVLRVTVYKG